MTSDTEHNLDAVAAEMEWLLAKATARPWKTTNGGLGIEGEPSSSTDHDPLVIAGLKGGKGQVHWPSYGIYSTPGRKEGETNAALIVAAINALPALLEERKRLREALQPMESGDIEEAWSAHRKTLRCDNGEPWPEEGDLTPEGMRLEEMLNTAFIAGWNVCRRELRKARAARTNQ